MNHANALFGRNIRNELFWVIIGQFTSLLGGLASVKMLTNLMGPDQYGIFSIGMSICGIMMMLFYGPLSQVVMRFYSVCRERTELSEMYHVMIRIHRRYLIIFASLGILVFPLIWQHWGEHWALVAFAALVFGVINGTSNTMYALFNAVRHRMFVALFQSADLWLRFLLAVLFLGLIGNDGYVALAGYVAGGFIVVLLLFRRLRIKFFNQLKSNCSTEALAKINRKFAEYGRPFIIFAIFGGISQYVDRWILQGYYGEEMVGIYAAITQIATSLVVIISTIVSQFISPIVFEHAGEMVTVEQRNSGGRIINKTATLTALLMVVIVIFSFIFDYSLVRLLTNEKFSKYADILWIVVTGMAAFQVAQLFVLHGLNAKKPSIYIVPKVLQAMTFVLVGFLLVRSMNIYGMAIALCVSSLVYLAMVIVVNSKLSIAGGQG